MSANGCRTSERMDEDGRCRVHTFDGNALAGPLLLKGCEAFPLADADDVLLEVKLLSVEAQQTQPQLPH